MWQRLANLEINAGVILALQSILVVDRCKGWDSNLQDAKIV